MRAAGAGELIMQKKDSLSFMGKKLVINSIFMKKITLRVMMVQGEDVLNLSYLVQHIRQMYQQKSIGQ